MSFEFYNVSFALGTTKGKQDLVLARKVQAVEIEIDEKKRHRRVVPSTMMDKNTMALEVKPPAG